MNWQVVRIETTPQAGDIVSSILMDAGAGGVEMEGVTPDVRADEYLPSPVEEAQPTAVKAYYGEDGFDATLGYIKGRLESAKYTSDIDFGLLRVDVSVVEDTDWNANFKKHFTTFRAAGNIVVKPTWEEYAAREDEIVIEMDPGMAFGSGTHETTRMCLELAQKYMKPGDNVLDVGCGSGILGISCAKLGAADVLALDYDPVSVQVTQENAQRNGVENLEARQSDLLQNADTRQYDVVFANIIADIVIRLNAAVCSHMKDEAVYIVSGIIEDRLDDVIQSIEQNGLRVVETLKEADWRALAVRKAHA